MQKNQLQFLFDNVHTLFRHLLPRATLWPTSHDAPYFHKRYRSYLPMIYHAPQEHLLHQEHPKRSWRPSLRGYYRWNHYIHRHQWMYWLYERLLATLSSNCESHRCFHRCSHPARRDGSFVPWEHSLAVVVSCCEIPCEIVFRCHSMCDCVSEKMLQFI